MKTAVVVQTGAGDSIDISYGQWGVAPINKMALTDTEIPRHGVVYKVSPCMQ